MKCCSGCKKELPHSEFNKNKRRSDGLQNVCKSCHKSLMSKWYDKNKHSVNQKTNDYRKENLEKYAHCSLSWRIANGDKVEAHNIRAKCARKGISVEQYVEALQSQGRLCLVCGSGPGKKSLHIDHDHSCCPDVKACGKCFRGLICHACNVILGLAKDEPKRLQLLIKYLEDNARRYQ